MTLSNSSSDLTLSYSPLNYCQIHGMNTPLFCYYPYALGLLQNGLLLMATLPYQKYSALIVTHLSSLVSTEALLLLLVLLLPF